jgi:CO dehydrogenase maturation factor
MKLAISGKGGVGKTTIASTLTRLFAESHDNVYAVDADPDACLAAAFGIPDEEARELVPVVDMKDEISKKSDGGGAFFSLNPEVDDILEKYSIPLGNIKFFKMGGVKHGGSACYCKENTFLSAMVSELLIGQKDVVIMDMGAGIEHLTRGTARAVDIMLVVVEPSKNSINTARNIQRLAKELGIKKVRIIGNKIRNEKEKEFISNSFQQEEVLGFIKFDDAVWESAMDKGPAAELGGELLASMKEIHQRLLKEGDR